MIDEVHGARQLALLTSQAESGSCLQALRVSLSLACFSAYSSIVLLVLSRHNRIFSSTFGLYITA